MFFILLTALMFNVFILLIQRVAKRPAFPAIWTVFLPLARGAQAKMNKAGRSRQDIIFRGFLAYIFVLFAAVAIYFLLEGLRYAALTEDAMVLIYGFVLALCSSPFFYLGQFDLEKLAKGVGLSLSHLDNAGQQRFRLLITTQMYVFAFLTPVFWLYILGIGGCLFASITLAMAMVAGKYGHHNGFSTVPNTLAFLLTLIPNIGGTFIFLIVSAFTPGFKIYGGLRAITSWNKAPHFLQGGWPLLVLARASGYTLGGSLRDSENVILKNDWVGNAKETANIPQKKQKNFLFFFVLATLLAVLILAAFLL